MGEAAEDSKGPMVARALALALMRQALALLDAVGETEPAVHLQMAVDTMKGPLRTRRCDPSNIN